jgi:hypothetical protein
MDKHIELKITSPTTEVNVSSVDAEEVARIVQLAGIQRPTPMNQSAELSTPMLPSAIPPAPLSMPDTDMQMPAPSEDVPHDMQHNDHDDIVAHDAELGEQQAEFDFGDNPSEADGDELSVNDYLYKAERLPQRIKGSNGDSGLLEEIQNNLWSKYNAFLKEEASRENDDGVMSPLSDPTKPEFDKDPLSGETPVDDGSHSPMSTIVRQPFNK